MSSTIQEIKPGDPRFELRLERSIASWRSFFSATMTILCIVGAIIAAFPLFSVLYTLLSNGLDRLGSAAFTTLPPDAPRAGQGFGNAIIGTIITVGIASAIAVPFGILVGLYLSEFGELNRTGSIIRFSAKVMTGLPSIIAGVVAYALVVLPQKHFSALAGGLALALLMLPIVILTAEEAFKQVPRKMREAAFGMGCTQTQVALKVTVPTAAPGVLTGVMLAVARACGETAPLLFTAFILDDWFKGDVGKPITALSTFIYKYATEQPDPENVKLAWTASLVLVALVFSLNLAAQALTRTSQQERR